MIVKSCPCDSWLTIIEQVAFFPPSFVLTVIIAEPTAFAVTVPLEETVATEVLFEAQDTDLLVALDGVTVAVNVWVSPTVIVIEVLLRLTPVTETVALETVTEHVAFLAPSFVVTVIVAVPAAFAVTTPEEETVATEDLFDDQVTDLSVALDGVTVAVSVCLSPTVKERDVLSRLTPVTETVAAETLTEQVAVFPPSFVVAVTFAVPAALAVTTPEEDTVATEVLLDDHVTDLSVALDGVTVAVRVCVSPSIMVRLVLFKLTPVTETFCACTVTVHVAFFPPSVVVTVIVADPAAFAVTTPEEETVATEVLLEDHFTDLSVALVGETVADNVCSSPSVMLKLVLSSVIPDTGMTLAFTVTAHEAVLPPSSVVTVISVVPSAKASIRPD